MHAQAVNQKVVLVSSSNKYLTYPVKGLIEDAELACDGSMIWATFRVDRADGRPSCPVIIREIKTA